MNSQNPTSSRCTSTGTKATGIKGPIIRPGDNLAEIVADSIAKAIDCGELSSLRNKDIVAITESVVAKAQGNFASLDKIGEDLMQKYPSQKEIGIVFPILSRNRFSKILEAIAKPFEKVYILLSYPSDEVGNHLIALDKFYESEIGRDNVYTAKELYEKFGSLNHEITGVDYVKLYESICEGKAEIIFSNDPKAILSYTQNVLACDIHTRMWTKKRLSELGATVYGLDDIMTKSMDGSGYNPDYGLLGSNMSSDTNLKLFPRDCEAFVTQVQDLLKEKFGVCTEVLVYGDGAYKDPRSKIWELADPVVSPGFTEGLAGSPNEIKFKYIADNVLANLSQEEAQSKLKEMIGQKTEETTKQGNNSLGTTPRDYASLIGSLSDLTSGSGDKGTFMVVIQDYFSNYAN